MFHKTEGILIKKTVLSGSRLILKIYTEEFGLKSYFGRNSKKEKKSYLPLSIVSLTAYDNPKKTIHGIKDYELVSPLSSIYTDIYKSTVLLFINEIINSVIQEEETNKEKFHFIKNQILLLEEKKFDSNFHLVFLMKFTALLGFIPHLDGKGIYYDLEEGELTNRMPIHPNFMDESETKLFRALFNLCEETNSVYKIDNNSRKRTLQTMVMYYRYHTDMRELKSLPVLETVFS